jgi:crooked neck
MMPLKPAQIAFQIRSPSLAVVEPHAPFEPLSFASALSAAMDLDGPMRAPVRAKSKAPAPMQITAEQILREAAERQEGETKPPRQRITDPDELAAFCLRKRKGFEDALRINRQHVPHWINYAKFEESQDQFDRARSVFERALEVDHRDKKLWICYAEMEMRSRHVNAARNVWDRAVTLLPRVSVLWFRYAYMEEMLGNVAGARAIFERWVAWEPDDNAWTSFVRLELRHNHADGARRVFARYVRCHAVPRAYIRWAKFEESQGEVANARSVFEASLSELRDDIVSEELLAQFAGFEERQSEFARARTIFKYALSLDALDSAARESLRHAHAQFERAHGDKQAVETVVHEKKVRAARCRAALRCA